MGTRVFYSAWLNARGRMLFDTFLYRTAFPSQDGAPEREGYFIELDQMEVTNLRHHINKRKLRAKVKMRELPPEELSVFSVWADDVAALWRGQSLISPAEVGAANGTEVGVPMVFHDPRAPGMGLRMLCAPDRVGETLAQLSRMGGSSGSVANAASVAAEAAAAGPTTTLSYTLRRFLLGVPEGSTEIYYDGAFPMECNMDLMGGTDFHKGCYLGQELTIRTHHTGMVRKRLLPVQLHQQSATNPSEDQHSGTAEGTDEGQQKDEKSMMPVYDQKSTLPVPTTGSFIKNPANRNRTVGEFIRGIGNVGLAMCRLEMMTDLELAGSAMGRPGPDAKFVVTDVQQGNSLMVTPFVPPWLREFIAKDNERKAGRR